MEKYNNFTTEEFKLDKRLAGFYCYITSFKDKEKIENIPIEHIIGVAVGADKDDLRARSRFEAVERYCLYTKNTTGMRFMYARNTNKPYFPVEKCIFYSKNQESLSNFPFLKRRSKQKTYWVNTHSLNNNSNIFLPYHYVFPRREIDRCELFDGWSTNGGASHFSVNRAIVNGVLELVERDAIMCSWISMSGVSKIDMATLNSKRLYKLIKLLNKLGFDVSLFSAKNELGISTIIAILDKKNECFLSFGSACKADMYIAAEKAIYESVMIRNTQYELIRHRLVKNSEGLRRHVAAPIIYGRKMCSWLFNGKIKVESMQMAEKTQPKSDNQIVGLIKKNFSLNIFDYSDRSVSKNLKVIKCIAPQLHPLELSSIIYHADLRRVKQFANSSVIKVNHFIHPFG